MGMTAPVRNGARSDARKHASSATSSGSPARRVVDALRRAFGNGDE
jgi:hypothetical protein